MNEDGNGPTPSQGRSSKIRTYVMLHGILLLYSLAALCSKQASAYEFLSVGFIGWYLGVLLLLVLYAVLWQQILKRLPLVTAYANKAVTVVWGFLWGALFFNEHISLTMLIGAAIAMVGIVLVVTSDE